MINTKATIATAREMGALAMAFKKGAPFGLACAGDTEGEGAGNLEMSTETKYRWRMDVAAMKRPKKMVIQTNAKK